MIQRIDLRGADRSGVDYRAAVPRADFDVEAAVPAVHAICEDVRTRGLDAIRELSQRFDGVAVDDVRVAPESLQRSLEELDPAIRAGLEESIRRLRLTCANELEQDAVTDLGPGARVTHRKVPVGRVGLYVPGGLAPLPSSVLMNVIPAQVAGVGSIAVASPPRRDEGDRPDRTILAACALLGVEEVYAVGGAQAVAMLAYGVEGVDPVDLVTGPGNVYVTAAKRLLRGVVGIDAEAGPSEVMVVADATADPVLVAADLLSQAEHGPTSASVLVTDAAAVADAVDAALEQQVADTKHVERVTEALTGPQSGTVLVRDLDQALEVADAYGAEHLEIHTADPATVARRVRNAGCVFVGPQSPVSLGDYAAGSNHVLPTGGSCRHTAGLSVETFLRGVNYVEYDEAALRGIGEHVLALAHAEDLPAHANAIVKRTGR